MFPCDGGEEEKSQGLLEKGEIFCVPLKGGKDPLAGRGFLHHTIDYLSPFYRRKIVSLRSEVPNVTVFLHLMTVGVFDGRNSTWGGRIRVGRGNFF